MFYLETGGKKLEYIQQPSNYDTSKPTLLVLSNSYGILKYTNELLELLSKDNKFNIFAFNLSGQGNSNGILSLENACNDLNSIFDFLNNNFHITNDNFYLYINCSGLFPVLELAKKRDLNFIKKIVVYNYLHTPHRLYKQGLKNMDQYNVRHTNKPIDSNYNVFEGFKFLSVPVVIFHTRIKANVLRAKEDEIKLLCKTFPNITYFAPDVGYDIVDFSQYSLIEKVVNNDLRKILN